MPFKVVILNDTSVSGHFGGRLVMNALHAGLTLRGIEVLDKVQVREPWEDHRDVMDKADLIIVNGEGSIHHGARMELLEVAKFYPSALINAVYQEVPSNEWIKDFKYISVRESLSQAKVAEHGAVAKVVPDVIFTHTIPRPEIIEDLCITDSAARKGGLNPLETNFIKKMGGSAKVCTGRFHGACLAMLWNMPFAAYPSNTHKTEGMMTDAGCLHLFKPTQEEALEVIDDFDASDYVARARESISEMFNDIHAIH